MRHYRRVNSFGDVVMLLAADCGNVYRLARRSGLTHTGIWAMIRGKRSPSSRPLSRLLAAAGRPWAWLDEVLGLRDPPADAASGGVGTGCRHQPEPQPDPDHHAGFPELVTFFGIPDTFRRAVAIV